MKPLKIHTQTGICEIVADESVKNLKNQLRDERYVIITDKNVRRFYSDLFSGNPIIEIGLGEKIKTLRTVEKIYQKFLEFKMDRSSFVIGIGGGVVCDIAGFSASTYMAKASFRPCPLYSASPG